MRASELRHLTSATIFSPENGTIPRQVRTDHVAEVGPLVIAILPLACELRRRMSLQCIGAFEEAP
jgi:hypothetical protein